MPDAPAITPEELSAIKGLTPEKLLNVQKTIGNRLAAALDDTATQAAPEEEIITPAVTETSESTPIVPETNESVDDSKPVLSDAVRRSLKAYEWTDEEIEEHLGTYGDKFVTHADKLHQTRTKEIQREADFGRRVKGAPKQQTVVPNQTNTSSDKSAVSAKVDLEEFKKKFGNDPLLEALAPVIERQNKQDADLSEWKKWKAKQEAAEQSDFNRRIDAFFDSPALESYRKHYGNSKTGQLPKELYENRYRVAEFADDLIRGRMERGEAVTLEEALDLAHDALSADLKAANVKQQTIDELKKRGQALSQRPSARPSPVDTTPKDTKALARHIRPKLKEAFGIS
jgi:hypothetical protein